VIRNNLIQISIQYFTDSTLEGKIVIIPPSIPLPNRNEALALIQAAKNIPSANLQNMFKSNEFINNNWFSLRKSLGISDSDKLLLLPCGIRPVKDPEYLLGCFPWTWKGSRVFLIIIGPVLDTNCFSQLERRLQMIENKSVIYLPNVPQRMLFAAMLESTALINCSISEGLSNALLEAMYLKVPVIARNISGNQAVIKHEHTGWLFNSPEEFKLYAEQLFEADEGTRTNLIDAAYQYVTLNHSLENERTLYESLVHSSMMQC
jgi:glycosyltransferase involved in cell wall biosynthesis